MVYWHLGLANQEQDQGAMPTEFGKQASFGIPQNWLELGLPIKFGKYKRLLKTGTLKALWKKVGC